MRGGGGGGREGEGEGRGKRGGGGWGGGGRGQGVGREEGGGRGGERNFLFYHIAKSVPFDVQEPLQKCRDMSSWAQRCEAITQEMLSGGG